MDETVQSADASVQYREKIVDNEHYELWTLRLPDSPLLTYGVLNKKTGVVEMSTTILGHARKMLQSLNEWESGKDPDPIGASQMVLPDIMN